jgi:hypothetical protein
VTDGLEGKTSEAMAAISSNLVTVEPGLDALAAGLAEAVRRVEDFEGRARGADVSWSSSWEQSLDDELMARVEALLAG